MKKKAFLIFTALIMLLAGLSGLIACVGDDDKDKDNDIKNDDTSTTYTVTFVADGKTVGTDTYTATEKDITEPKVPNKDGYVGIWEDYTLTTGDITVNAVYNAITTEGLNYVFQVDEYVVASYTGEDLDVVIPSKHNGYPVTRIEESAFSELYIKSILIAEGITSIGQNAFHECVDLVSVKLPKTLTDIGNEAFIGLLNLSEIVIPESVKTIGEEAFNYCPALTIRCETKKRPESWIFDFNPYPYKCPIVYDCYNNNVADDGHTYYIDSNGLRYALKGNTATITRQAATLPDNIVIPKTITYNGAKYEIKTIGDSAFTYNRDLVSIKIPNGVTRIGDFAFLYCEKLNSVIIPNGATHIGIKAFSNCYGLKNLEIPKTVKTFGEKAFYKSTALENIKYDGTKAQWNAIAKGENWDFESKNYTVSCSDGTITKA